MLYSALPFFTVSSNSNDKYVVKNYINGRILEIGKLAGKILLFINKNESTTLENISEEFSYLDQDKLKTVLSLLMDKQLITTDLEYENSLIRIEEYKEPIFGFNNYKKGENDKICILGIPCSRGNQISIGQRRFPLEIRNYVRISNIKFTSNDIERINFRALDNNDYKQFLDNIRLDLYRDYGDYLSDINESNDFFYRKIGMLIRNIITLNNIPITIGGDHSITYPIIKSLIEKYNRINIIHFDAHTDTYSSPYDNIRHDLLQHHYGNFMKYCLELEEVNMVYQYGVRGFENLYTSETSKQKIFYCDYILENIDKSELYEIPNDLPYYITFDLDCLVPGTFSGTANPVFKGLELKETVLLLRRLLKNKKVIGIDIVEANPDIDKTTLVSQITLYILINFLNLIVTDS